MRTVEDLTEASSRPERAQDPAAAVRGVSLVTWLAVGILGFGAVLRLGRYVADRSLWLDESLLSINLMTRSYRELLETLDYNQGAPIGFLWTERLALDLFGDSELSLRFFPLLVGLVSLALFYLVSRAILDRTGFLVGLGLFAAMEPFVRYSAEVKQYGLDVAVCLALVYLFVRVLESGQLSTRGAVLVAAAGPCAVAFSHPSVFVLAGVAVAGLYAALQSGSSRAALRQLAAYGVWLVSFLVVYLVAIRDLHDLQGTVRGVGGGGGGRFKNVYTIFSEPGGFPRTAVGLAAALALIGVVSLWLRRPGFVVLLAVTTSSLLAAGYLGLYPVGQRFLLFLLPLVVLCLAEGISVVATQRSRLIRFSLMAAVAALILLPVAGTAAKRLTAPPKVEEIEPLLSGLASSWRPGDVLYLSPESQYAFRYYAECEDCGSTGAAIRRLWPSRPTVGSQAQSTPAIVSRSASLVVGEGGSLDDSGLAGRTRVWLLYTHFFPRTEADVLGEADRIGTRIGCRHGGASLLCLYDFSRVPTKS
jgi:Dolichyl-phosphate-mannose-protein mannosyltransferase